MFPVGFLKVLNSAARNGFRLRAFFVVFFFSALRIFGGTQTIWLGWDIAPWDENIIEYRVLYGTQSGVYTNSDISYNWDGAVIYGLEQGKTYYFAVSGTDVDGNNSPLSSELAYVVPVPTPAVLQTEVYTDGDGVPFGMGISSSWNIPTDWELDYSTDLINWSVWQSSHGTSVSAYWGFDWSDQAYFRLIQN